MPCNIKKNLSQHPNRRSELITSGGGLLFFMIKFIRKVSDFEQKKKQIDSNIESAQNVILSNCTKPRTGQLKNIGIWG